MGWLGTAWPNSEEIKIRKTKTIKTHLKFLICTWKTNFIISYICTKQFFILNLLWILKNISQSLFIILFFLISYVFLYSSSFCLLFSERFLLSFKTIFLFSEFSSSEGLWYRSQHFFESFLCFSIISSWQSFIHSYIYEINWQKNYEKIY